MALSLLSQNHPRTASGWVGFLLHFLRGNLPSQAGSQLRASRAFGVSQIKSTRQQQHRKVFLLTEARMDRSSLGQQSNWGDGGGSSCRGRAPPPQQQELLACPDPQAGTWGTACSNHIKSELTSEEGATPRPCPAGYLPSKGQPLSAPSVLSPAAFPQNAGWHQWGERAEEGERGIWPPQVSRAQTEPAALGALLSLGLGSQRPTRQKQEAQEPCEPLHSEPSRTCKYSSRAAQCGVRYSSPDGK